MKALVFAAGLGTRLRPFTCKHPKALVEVAGKPMLRHVIDRLTNAGVDEIVVNVHHFADQIINYLRREESEIPARIHISDESDRLLDTGGGILKARKWLDNGTPFIVHNADILCDTDLYSMVAQHISKDADATLLVADRETSRKLLFDADGRMRGWINLSTGETKFAPELADKPEVSALTQLAFGGIHVLSPSVFPLLEEYAKADNKFSIVPFYIYNTHALNIRAFAPTHGSYMWMDIGKPESLEKARIMMEASNTYTQHL